VFILSFIYVNMSVMCLQVESKYPSFRLVFDFVQDIAWTKDK